HHRHAASGPAGGARRPPGEPARSAAPIERCRFLPSRPERCEEGLFRLRHDRRRRAGPLRPYDPCGARGAWAGIQEVSVMRIARLLACLWLAAALGGCWGTVTENPAAEYFRRTDTIVPDAGEAMKVNAVTHVVDPWPPYVGDRRIPADGERMVTAVQRTHRPS